jgi:ATP-dependent Clp protease protease subunit
MTLPRANWPPPGTPGTPPSPAPRPSPMPSPMPSPSWPPSWTPPGPPDRAPGESGLELELADRLLARRVVMLSGTLDRHAASTAAARLMILDADSAEPIELTLSCPDGDLEAALMLAETVDLARARVTAMLLSTLGGPAVAVAAAADRRVAHPGGRVLLREPRISATGRAEDLVSAAEQHAHLVGQLCGWLARATGRSTEEIAADLSRGRVLSAQQAVDYGLVHELLPPRH